MLLSNDSRRKALLAQRDIYGNTGLHLATHMGDKEIAGYLLMQGADRDAKNNVRNPSERTHQIGRRDRTGHR